MIRNLLALAPLLLPALAHAQTGKTPRDRVIVTATRMAQDSFEVPFSAATITSDDLRRRSYRTTPQALRDVPGVMIQETAHGHGSPYIRGFTSFRNLFLIDGIRLNNSVFRPGPNQYWNTVDALSLERLEIVKGPSSVLYGSDAAGGTVQAITRSPDKFLEEEGTAFGGRFYGRYSTAENSLQGRGEFHVGQTWNDGNRTGFLIGGSTKAFGDLRGGEDVGTQRETGYDETDIDIKVEHWLDEDTRLVFLHQRVDQDGVPRTHRTANGITWKGLSTGSDQRREFDQDRTLTYLQFHKENIDDVVDTVRVSLSWHQQDEKRDRVRSNGNQEIQGFEVGTLGLWLQAESETCVGRATFGVEYYHDNVDSFLRRIQNPQAADVIQGPVADDATYSLLGVYLQQQVIASKEFELTIGGRFNHAAADADSVRDPVTNNRIEIDDEWSSLVGSLRLLYRAVPERMNIFAGVSQGFRAPNLSDLSRFDSARSDEFEIPAPNLDPERYLSYELGVKVEQEEVAAEATFFYTDIEDQILRFPTGNTNGSGDAEVTKGNVGDGHVLGIEVGATARVTQGTSLFGNFTFVEGEVENFANATATLEDTWLTRLMPLTFQVGLRWEQEDGRCWAETVVVHAEKAHKLSFNDKRDGSRIPPGGTPSYTVWSARGGYRVSQNTTVNVLLENITDEDYRSHGSGLNRPGLNFIVSVSTWF